MYDFTDVICTGKTEQIRAWAVEQALDLHRGLEVTDEELIKTASAIEKFVVDGEAD